MAIKKTQLDVQYRSKLTMQPLNLKVTFEKLKINFPRLEWLILTKQLFPLKCQ